MSHKFKIGQRVRRTNPGVGTGDVRFGSNEVCEVVRLMPADQTGQVSYRIRAGFAERVAREDEIVASN